MAKKKKPTKSKKPMYPRYIHGGGLNYDNWVAAQEEQQKQQSAGIQNNGGIGINPNRTGNWMDKALEDQNTPTVDTEGGSGMEGAESAMSMAGPIGAIGAGMSAVGKAAGKFASDALNVGLPFLNSMIPDNQKQKRPAPQMVENPNPYGTGSSALFNYGGYMQHPFQANQGMVMPMANGQMQVEGNQYSFLSPETINLGGQSHEQGGTKVSYGGNMVEAEAGEPMSIGQDGQAVVWGNMNVPGSSTKFKGAAKKIAKEEKATTSLLGKATRLIQGSNPNNPYEALSFNSGRALQDAAAQKQNTISAYKDSLANLQQAMLDYSEVSGIKPEKLSKGMRKGGSIPMPKYANGGPFKDGLYSQDISQGKMKGIQEVPYNLGYGDVPQERGIEELPGVTVSTSRLPKKVADFIFHGKKKQRMANLPVGQLQQLSAQSATPNMQQRNVPAPTSNLDLQQLQGATPGMTTQFNPQAPQQRGVPPFQMPGWLEYERYGRNEGGQETLMPQFKGNWTEDAKRDFLNQRDLNVSGTHVATGDEYKIMNETRTPSTGSPASGMAPGVTFQKFGNSYFPVFAQGTSESVKKKYLSQRGLKVGGLPVMTGDEYYSAQQSMQPIAKNKYGGCMECGGSFEAGGFVPIAGQEYGIASYPMFPPDQDTPEAKSGFKLNPAHKGWCTPMTKKTCTGKRKQFAINAKNHFKKQKNGGALPKAGDGDTVPQKGPIQRAQEYMTSYVDSPVYKQRLDKQYKDPKESEKVWKEAKRNVRGETAPYYLPSDYAKPNDELIGSRITGSDLSGMFNKEWNTNIPDYADIILDPVQARKYGMDIANDVYAHEIGHQIRPLSWNEETDIGMLNKDQKALNYLNPPINQSISTYMKMEGQKKGQELHDSAPDESKADLDAIRNLMFQYGVYDTRQGDMTEADLQKALTHPKIKSSFTMKRMLKHFKPKDIVWMNNNIALNNQVASPTESIAKFGASIGNVGDEVELSPKEMAHYRSLGYDFEAI